MCKPPTKPPPCPCVSCLASPPHGSTRRENSRKIPLNLLASSTSALDGISYSPSAADPREGYATLILVAFWETAKACPSYCWRVCSSGCQGIIKCKRWSWEGWLRPVFVPPLLFCCGLSLLSLTLECHLPRSKVAGGHNKMCFNV